MGPKFDIRPIILLCVIAGAIIIGLVWGATALFSGKSRHVIESKTLITPEIKLTVSDNKVDTIYVYRQP